MELVEPFFAALGVVLGGSRDRVLSDPVYQGITPRDHAPPRPQHEDVGNLGGYRGHHAHVEDHRKRPL